MAPTSCQVPGRDKEGAKNRFDGPRGPQRSGWAFSFLDPRTLNPFIARSTPSRSIISNAKRGLLHQLIQVCTPAGRDCFQDVHFRRLILGRASYTHSQPDKNVGLQVFDQGKDPPMAPRSAFSNDPQSTPGQIQIIMDHHQVVRAAVKITNPVTDRHPA